MKHIALFILIICACACSEDNNLFEDITVRGGFVEFQDDLAIVEYSIIDLDNINVSGTLVDPNNNAISYALDVRYRDKVAKDLVTINSFPSALEVTSDMIFKALGITAADVEPDTRFDFVGYVTTPEGTFSGSLPDFDTKTNEPIGGNTTNNLYTNGLKNAMSFSIKVLPPNTLAIPIDSSSDDVEEGINGNDPGGMDVESSDLEFGEIEGSGTGVQLVGLRFNDVEVPIGVDIYSAYIQFTVDEVVDSPAPVLLRIRAETVVNPSTFSSDLGSVSSRTALTQSVVEWDVPVWTTVGESDRDQRSADLKSIIQELIDAPGWNSGNSISFIIEPSEETLNNGRESGRVAEAFDGDEIAAPTLIISYID